MLGILIRIVLAWLLIGVGGGVLLGEVREPGLGGFVYLFGGIAVALSGAAAHVILVLVPAFCRSIALLQVLAISVLALLLLFLYALTENGATVGPRGSLHLYAQALPYFAVSFLVVATVVNALFTPKSAA